MIYPTASSEHRVIKIKIVELKRKIASEGAEYILIILQKIMAYSTLSYNGPCSCICKNWMSWLAYKSKNPTSWIFQVRTDDMSSSSISDESLDKEFFHDYPGENIYLPVPIYKIRPLKKYTIIPLCD